MKKRQLIDYLRNNNIDYVVANQPPNDKRVLVWLGMYNLSPKTYLIAPTEAIIFRVGPYSIAPFLAYQLRYE